MDSIMIFVGVQQIRLTSHCNAQVYPSFSLSTVWSPFISTAKISSGLYFYASLFQLVNQCPHLSHQYHLSFSPPRTDSNHFQDSLPSLFSATFFVQTSTILHVFTFHQSGLLVPLELSISLQIRILHYVYSWLLFFSYHSRHFILHALPFTHSYFLKLS